ncbi:hypothetical protein BDK51DRAFT_31902 [Blyttiomyces helicus]|uniref:Uncharacterized protein n=1 Tax=Blyttiomyces helicus TaxID=388810 RepID=A0A4P9WEK0_9FUNG|nr:hypothetical protein BDK51DRAFT_31902 [Blyttiomyces helicus]|eukprot:RKO91024.1 hypothetical protein BDK51DRAFT_31902 [Blyttiomyces helicus]
MASPNPPPSRLYLVVTSLAIPADLRGTGVSYLPQPALLQGATDRRDAAARNLEALVALRDGWASTTASDSPSTFRGREWAELLAVLDCFVLLNGLFGYTSHMPPTPARDSTSVPASTIPRPGTPIPENRAPTPPRAPPTLRILSTIAARSSRRLSELLVAILYVRSRSLAVAHRTRALKLESEIARLRVQLAERDTRVDAERRRRGVLERALRSVLEQGPKAAVGERRELRKKDSAVEFALPVGAREESEEAASSCGSGDLTLAASSTASSSSSVEPDRVLPLPKETTFRKSLSDFKANAPPAVSPRRSFTLALGPFLRRSMGSSGQRVVPPASSLMTVVVVPPAGIEKKRDGARRSGFFRLFRRHKSAEQESQTAKVDADPVDGPVKEAPESVDVDVKLQDEQPTDPAPSLRELPPSELPLKIDTPSPPPALDRPHKFIHLPRPVSALSSPPPHLSRAHTTNAPLPTTHLITRGPIHRQRSFHITLPRTTHGINDEDRPAVEADDDDDVPISVLMARAHRAAKRRSTNVVNKRRPHSWAAPNAAS